jgi:ElaB/YqjD/DUF883 family membrane-anchored ribosome-binding protein
MDEATRQGSEAVEADGAQEPRSPEEIERDIQATREQLGDTVEELAAKADVKAQAKERVAGIKETAQQKKEEFVSKAKDTTPESASAGAEQVKAKAQQNPLPFAVGIALLAGFILGRLSSR